MWLVRVHGPPSKLDSNADREVRRDALDRALTPRDSDRGRVSVFEVADLEEARETACLHKALGPARLASVDFVLLPADAFGVDDVVVTPDARHSLLSARHREVVDMDDPERRSRLVETLLDEPRVHAERVRKPDAHALVLARARADCELEAALVHRGIISTP